MDPVRRSTLDPDQVDYGPGDHDDDGEVVHLTQEEVEHFLDDLDHNKDGLISYEEVEQKLDAVHDEIASTPQRHNLHHPSKDDQDRHAFLRAMIGSEAKLIPRSQFAQRVQEWKIPSMAQDASSSDHEYIKGLTVWRRLKSYWSVHGPEIAFQLLVIGSMVGMGTWQLVKYVGSGGRYTSAFGWGVVLAKTCAGALYPTMFFLLLSMSRYFSTFLRRSYTLSRFINWDLSQSFHIRISVVALLLATLHAIGHLSGSFVFGSRTSREDAVGALLGPDAVPRRYLDYVRSTPGFTGLTALGLFYLLAIISMPRIRRLNYEIFQLGHLLMFPIIGLLMAHGSAHLLQWPMLGYFMAFPTLLILIERVTRVCLGFRHIPATMRLLDSQTVEIKVTIPEERVWRYRAGQYVFLQVPEISLWQWHPFTISVCRGRDVQLHIKTDGNWTGKLRALAIGEDGGKEKEKETRIKVGINGPFGAPAQRFYDFQHTILVGAGIGITPFSGVLADLQARDNRLHGGPDEFEMDGAGLAGSSQSKSKSMRQMSILQPQTIDPDPDPVTTTTPPSPTCITLQDQTDQTSGSCHGNPKGSVKDGINAPVWRPRENVASPVPANDTDQVDAYRAVGGQPSFGGKLRRTLSNRSDQSDGSGRSRRSRRSSLSRRASRFFRRKRLYAPDYRRVDLHWIVRDRSHLSWFQNLLNTISRSQSWHRFHLAHLRSSSRDTPSHPDDPFSSRGEGDVDRGRRRGNTARIKHTSGDDDSDYSFPHLDIRIQTHVTQRRKNISTHVYRWLLEMHRTPQHPESPLTGLVNPTKFGRPDFVKILDEHYEDMVRFKLGSEVEMEDKLKVGVFFCGAPVVGEILADRCSALSARGRVDRTMIEYHFMNEVFG